MDAKPIKKDKNPIDPQHADNGRLDLVEKYNVNDKAHSDSSAADFVPTVSKFHHADPDADKPQDFGEVQPD